MHDVNGTFFQRPSIGVVKLSARLLAGGLENVALAQNPGETESGGASPPSNPTRPHAHSATPIAATVLTKNETTAKWRRRCCDVRVPDVGSKHPAPARSTGMVIAWDPCDSP
jgi:hypothetical protein